MMLLLAGCGQKAEMPATMPNATETPQAAATGAPRETEVPKRTAAPQATATPEATVRPATTADPKATGTPEAAGTVAPKATEAPQASEAPVTTEVPKATAAPEAAVTEAPKGTEAPQKTETTGTTEVSQENNDHSSTPAVTGAPKPTEAPKEETPAPVATEAPKPTEEPAATEAPKPTEEPAATEAPEVCQHDMQEFVFIEPTCKSIGDGCDMCSKCGYKENWHSIPQLEHDFEDDMIPGDCKSPAWHRYTCKNCGWTETAIGETDMNNHSNIKEVEYTDWDEETWETITYRAVKCMDCNTVFEEEEIGRELIVE